LQKALSGRNSLWLALLFALLMAGCFGDFFTKIPVLAVPEKGGPLPDSWYR
jgi:hypothetical protein